MTVRTAPMTCHLADENATLAFGARLADALRGPAILYLHGELGAGKTTLCRGLLRALGHTGQVRSPTYTLVEPYEVAGQPVFHFDLYRLRDPEELEQFGIRDYLDPAALLLFEWAEHGAGHLPAADVELTITADGAGRRIAWHASSVRGTAIVTRLESSGRRA